MIHGYAAFTASCANHLTTLKQIKAKSATNDIANIWKYLIMVVLIKNRVIENEITR